MEKMMSINKGHIATESDDDAVFLTRVKWFINGS